MSKKLVILATFMALFLLAGPALAQGPTDDEINAIAHDLNCPTCAGISLEDCNTQTCFQWRAQIGDLLGQGYSKQQVLDWYVERYGEQVLQEPPRRGIGLVAWLLPVLALLVGGVWVAFLLKKWAARKQAVPVVVAAAPAGLADEYLHQVEQDLKNL